MESLLSLLTWALSAGFSLWQILLIRTYRRLNKAKATRDTRDVWQQIAESNNEALLKQNEEIRQLRTTMAKVEKAMFHMVSCRHYSTCPARMCVQKLQTSLKHGTNRQSSSGNQSYRHLRDHPEVDGDPGPDGTDDP